MYIYTNEINVCMYVCMHACVRLSASAYHRQKYFKIKFVIYNNFMQHIKKKATVANAC